MRAAFIAGTDTEIGKTTVTCGLLRVLACNERSAVGMKPVASGAVSTPEGLRNEDALSLRAHSHPKLPYECVNPCVYREPASPHIAARRDGEVVTLNSISAAYAACSKAAEVVLVEGVGGWRVPLSDDLQTVDLVRHLKLPVILVCGLRLGCINHALLSAGAIVSDGVALIGWVANTIDPNYAYTNETVATLERAIPAPLIGVVPWQTSMDSDNIANAIRLGATRLWPLAPS